MCTYMSRPEVRHLAAGRLVAYVLHMYVVYLGIPTHSGLRERCLMCEVPHVQHHAHYVCRYALGKVRND